MMEGLRKKVEALVFSAGEPVNIERLAKFLGIKKTQCEEVLKDLESTYQQSDSGLQLIYKHDSVQLTSNAELGDDIAKFLNKELQEDVTPATMEVLAIVAYRGPLTRAQIDHIRGVNSSFALRNLAIRGLIDRKENPDDSRSYLYEVSFDFLKSLGMKKIENLPDYENLHQAYIPQLEGIKEVESKKQLTETNNKILNHE